MLLFMKNVRLLTLALVKLNVPVTEHITERISELTFKKKACVSVGDGGLTFKKNACVSAPGMLKVLVSVPTPITSLSYWSA
jgi:hypothetical protein